MAESSITLGGQTYALQPLSLRGSLAWRQRLAAADQFTPVLDILCAFSPPVAADRARIEQFATDAELQAAFAAVFAIIHHSADESALPWPQASGDLEELARVEWGVWADELDDLALAQLLSAWTRRTRFEAAMLAETLMLALSVAPPARGLVGPLGAPVPSAPSLRASASRQVSPAEFMRISGGTL